MSKAINEIQLESSAIKTMLMMVDESSSRGTKVTKKTRISTVISRVEELGRPIGSPIEFFGGVVPNGYLRMDGSAFDVNIYPNLAVVYPSGVLPDINGRAIKHTNDHEKIGEHEGQSIGMHDHEVTFEGLDDLRQRQGRAEDLDLIISAEEYVHSHSNLLYYPDGGTRMEELDPNIGGVKILSYSEGKNVTIGKNGVTSLPVTKSGAHSHNQEPHKYLSHSHHNSKYTHGHKLSMRLGTNKKNRVKSITSMWIVRGA